MTAIPTSLAIFEKICTLAETKINEHLNVADAVTDKAQANNLYASFLSDEIAKEVGIKQSDCLHIVYIYLQNRPELEINKKNGICRVTDDANKTTMTPQQCAHKFYNIVKNYAETLLEEEFLKAEQDIKNRGVIAVPNLNIQDLALNVANKLNIKRYAAYYCLRDYIQTERKNDLVIGAGRGGGIRRR